MENVVDSRFVERRLSKHSDRIGAVEGSVNNITKQIEDLNNRLDQLNDSLEEVRRQLSIGESV